MCNFRERKSKRKRKKEEESVLVHSPWLKNFSGSDLRFVDNELDAAILKAKKVPDAKRKKKKKKKKKKRWQENNKEKKNSSNDECGKGPEATKYVFYLNCVA